MRLAGSAAQGLGHHICRRETVSGSRARSVRGGDALRVTSLLRSSTSTRSGSPAEFCAKAIALPLRWSTDGKNLLRADSRPVDVDSASSVGNPLSAWATTSSRFTRYFCCFGSALMLFRRFGMRPLRAYARTDFTGTPLARDAAGGVIHSRVAALGGTATPVPPEAESGRQRRSPHGPDSDACATRSCFRRAAGWAPGFDLLAHARAWD